MPQNCGKLQQVMAPGKSVSVYQLESSILGFIVQLKGRTTKHLYRAATIFINHHSDISYVYLHNILTFDDMVQAKKAFEVYIQKRGRNNQKLPYRPWNISEQRIYTSSQGREINYPIILS